MEAVISESLFEKQKSSLDMLNLDSCHYFSAPGLLWDATLKMTGVRLEKISDPDKYMFSEQEMRDGVGYINKRYSEASKNVNILYFVTNKLYGHAMSQYLLCANFKWVKNIDKIKQKLINIKSNSSSEYVLEVDLEYPQKLHSIHNNNPLAPEKTNIQKEWLSKYCLKIVSVYNITTGTVKKFVPNLMSKNSYVIHYRNLQ